MKTFQVNKSVFYIKKYAIMSNEKYHNTSKGVYKDEQNSCKSKPIGRHLEDIKTIIKPG